MHTTLGVRAGSVHKPLAGLHCARLAVQEGLRLLQGQLAGEVGARQEELLGQAARLAAAEAAFSGSALAVTSLQAALHRVRVEITDPYREARPPTRESPARKHK